MAKQTLVSLVDDLDGSEAKVTIDFSFRGRNYVIDLNDEHAAQMQEVLTPYIDAARKPGFAGRSNRASASSATAIDTDAVRRWAKDNGHQVAARGRIPARVLEAYRGAHY